jgi:hypothetical protein
MSTFKPEDIVRATEFARQYPHLFPSKNSLQWQLKNRATNGLSDSGAVLELNGKLYFHIPKYMDYLASKAA